MITLIRIKICTVFTNASNKIILIGIKFDHVIIPNPLIPLPFTSNARGTYRFVPTTVGLEEVKTDA
jgi:hypothetical protein